MILFGLLLMLGLFHWLLTRKHKRPAVSRNQQAEPEDMDNIPWVLGE